MDWFTLDMSFRGKKSAVWYSQNYKLKIKIYIDFQKVQKFQKVDI